MPCCTSKSNLKQSVSKLYVLKKMRYHRRNKMYSFLNQRITEMIQKNLYHVLAAQENGKIGYVI